MKTSKNRKATLTSLFLALSFALAIIALPTVNAHDPPWTIPTYAYINVAPNPAGIGQTVYISFYIDKVPPTAEGNWGYKWHGMKVTVTEPNGDIETLNMPDSDAAGGTWASYVLDQVGTYKFVGTFPEQTAVVENPYPHPQGGMIPLGDAFINDTYTASTSKEFLLTVIEESVVSAYPDAPLPTEYWSRPINSMNREWYTIGGNWLGLGAPPGCSTGLYNQNGNFNPYTTAPESAHVLWTLPEAFGGQIGGEFGDSETGLYSTGTAYEGKFGAVILYGILYYTAYPGAENNPGPLTAVDLHTGKTLWTKDVAAPLRCGMIYNFKTGNQYGAHAYLFTAPAAEGWIMRPLPNAWSMYEAMTGEWILDIANASAGTLVRGENGEILSYKSTGGMLRLWNMSKCIEAGSQKRNTYVMYSSEEIWRPPLGATIDWNDGYEWSVPLAANISGVPIIPPLGVSRVSDEVVLVTAQSGGLAGGVPGFAQLGYEFAAGYSAIDGSLLWGPVNRTLLPFTVVNLGTAGEGIYTEYNQEMMTFTGYSLKTGEKMWTTAPKNSTWGYYDRGNFGVIGYGNFYAWGIGGEVSCYDVQTAELKWSWNSGSGGVDSPYGNWPLGTFNRCVLADGKLYIRAGHDYTPPVFKGAKLYCLNATTGEEIWSSLSFDIASSSACADGVMVWYNGYDNQIYAYGKGPSVATVAASPKISTFGSSVLVEGMVADISPGTEEYVQTARFPNGVPAISDEDQSAWMEYLYQQQPKPADAKGVDVTISVLDPNGNCYDVGTATSDATGFYKLTFTPLVPGEYSVYATFTGSESYYGSSATTAITVEEAPAATAEPTPVPGSAADLYFLPMSIGTIVAIIVIGLVLILMLRKR
jgi:hypothetical protein